MHESRRSAEARGGAWWQPSNSHQLSLPPIQLSQVLRPAPRFKPTAQHISNPSSHPAINPSTSPINRSISITLTHSIHPSIHPLLPASRYSVVSISHPAPQIAPIQLSQVLRPASRFKPAAQHISNPSINPSINPAIFPHTHCKHDGCRPAWRHCNGAHRLAS
eukprot:COSAG06_NODE_9448_length_1900_cov_28.085047_2_plen_163_part_00